MNYDPIFNDIKRKQEEYGITNREIHVSVLLFGDSTTYTITPKIRIEAEDLCITPNQLEKIANFLRFTLLLNSEFYISSGKLKLRKIPVYDTTNTEEINRVNIR